VQYVLLFFFGTRILRSNKCVTEVGILGVYEYGKWTRPWSKAGKLGQQLCEKC